jgi:tetratricopeptide (TPR) repeat protein
MNHKHRPADFSPEKQQQTEPSRETTAADWFGAGLKLHQAGRLVEAEALYRRTLAICPNHPDALHLLGVIASLTSRHELAVQLIELAIQQDGYNPLYHSNCGLSLQALGRLEKALESYDRALAIHPEYAEALFNRGVTLQKLRRLDLAVRSYDRAVAVRPDYAEAFCNRGVALQELGRLAEALESHDRALVLRPNFAEALSNRGNALKAVKRPEDALESYDQALALRPDFVEVLYNRGNTLKELKRLDDAVESYDRAVSLCPHYAEAWSNRGAALEELGRLEDALKSYDRAVAGRADFVEALSNRGNSLRALGRFEEALQSYDSALVAQPKHVEVLYNRGIALQELQRFADAVESYDQALAGRPHHAEALSNRGVALQELRRFADAIESYDLALAARPGYAEAQWNKALLLLLNGSFADGWLGYESRRSMAGWGARSFEGTEWSGDSLAGKRLLLYAEQGLGDTIQFARYVSFATAQGARVILEVQSPLKSLLSGLSGAEVVVAKGDPLPAFDLHCPLLSMPLLFATTRETIPADVPYIRAAADRREFWGRRLPRDAALIGFVWSGNPQSSKDRQRSIPFEKFAPLLTVPGVQFVSLQKDVRPTDARAFREQGKVIDLGADLKDFSDTAAIVSQLDMVVTVDTAVAHLAGAMAKPVWILLPYVPDFRWLLDRNDSPWYPSARLFRQSKASDWDEVIWRVTRELTIASPFLLDRRSKISARFEERWPFAFSVFG